MSTSQQPLALRLADKYEIEGFLGDQRYAKDYWCSQAAAELRRQHARIADLEAQLSAIGAGGVEPLRKREASAAAPAVLPEPEAWLATFRPKGILSSHSIAGTNLEELKRSVPSDSKFKPLYAQPILTIVGMSTTVQTEQGGTQQ